jgi:hypothetical protein
MRLAVSLSFTTVANIDACVKLLVALLFTILACAWQRACHWRGQELKRRSSEVSHAKQACTDIDAQRLPAPCTALSEHDRMSTGQDVAGNYPKVAVVLPVATATLDIVNNWRRQLQMWYPAAVTVLFVCDTESSHAAAAVKALVKTLTLPETRHVSVVAAGRATQCSQKNLKCVAHSGCVRTAHQIIKIWEEGITCLPVEGTMQLWFICSLACNPTRNAVWLATKGNLEEADSLKVEMIRICG